MIRWHKASDPIEPDESKQILFYAGGSSFPYLGFYYKHDDRFGDWKAEDVQKWQYIEEILRLANQAPEKRYTFSAMSLGSKIYPMKIEDLGSTDYWWTDKIEEAMTWPEKEMVEVIAKEYYDTEIEEVYNGI